MSKLGSRSASPLNGVVTVPGDKSISHRALMIGASAVGETRITGLLEAEDVLRTADALRALGARVEKSADGWSVQGVGVGGFATPDDIVDLGNSGTAARLLLGLMATQDIEVQLTGDASLRSRPMDRVIVPLSQMGAAFDARDGGRMPLVLHGAAEPIPVEYTVPVPSAQVKSAILLAALNTPGTTTVIEREATRDHTENMLRSFGAAIDVSAAADGGRRIEVTGFAELTATDVAVPGDPSSAAFPGVAALLVPGSAITVENIGMNPLRAGDTAAGPGRAACQGKRPVFRDCRRSRRLRRDGCRRWRRYRHPGMRRPDQGRRGNSGQSRPQDRHGFSRRRYGLVCAGRDRRCGGHRDQLPGIRRTDERDRRKHRAGRGRMTAPVVIAVDGPAASGKGTLARRLAAALGYAYLDTGLLYRAIGLALLRAGQDPADADAAAAAAASFDAGTADFSDPALRDEETGRAAGIVAAIPAVRAALTDVQRRFAADPPGGAPGAVLDGRDIGTVICPDADYKFFIEAAIEERARRRVKELQDRGVPSIPARVLQEMKERDERDRTRAVAPLAPAADASVVDTTNLNADAAFALAMSFIR